MPSVSLENIHDIGGWCFAALILGAVVYAFIKGLIVARAIYDEANQRVVRAEEREKVFLNTIQELIAGVKTLTSSVESGKGKT